MAKEEKFFNALRNAGTMELWCLRRRFQISPAGGLSVFIPIRRAQLDLLKWSLTMARKQI